MCTYGLDKAEEWAWLHWFYWKANSAGLRPTQAMLLLTLGLEDGYPGATTRPGEAEMGPVGLRGGGGSW